MGATAGSPSSGADKSSVVLRGEIDIANADAVAAELLAAAAGPGDVVVRLDEVTFLDSSGLGALVRCIKALEGTDRRLVLRGASPPIHRVLELGGLTGLAQIEG